MLDDMDLERERGITILSKNTAIQYRDHKQHHLGMTVTAVIPPEYATAFSPG